MGMQSVRAFNYVQQFSCIAERCEDNCCKGNWRIAVSPRSRDLYSRDYPELLNLIVKDDSGYQMDKAGGQCGALQGGRCQIHAKQGAQILTDTCANYPRMYRRINNALVKSATLSCPEVARIGLFGESPFQIEESQEDDHHLYGSINQELPGVSPSQWRAVVEALLQISLSPELGVAQVLLRLYAIASRLSELPHARWPEHLPYFAEPLSLVAPNNEAISADPLLIVLINVLNAPGAPDSMRQQLLSATLVVPGETPAQAQWTLKAEYQALYRSTLHHALEPILQRFIAAEMTRTGFPYLSTTSAGQDYGLNLREWAATLAIRTLTLRHLLIAHSDIRTQKAPDNPQIVDVVYRFCRAASHNAATPAEKTLRKAITDKGLSYLEALIRQV
ncbi:lysine-N-methylase [Pseudomonas cuatrocienegasensis]|uniref:Lysine-N-methylase n=1 Tax=Pseudomonas cuatrocienegasensis TaxID=543360 RepID=A0ABY1B913_9PSED|nr:MULTISPECIES: flagellin lysine-N-methylase [Pseudomonas]OEC35684.1 hypothetical protein A7D25_07635 [Pseudomonas sp. 21C1]SEQ24881.1 lysine-N-methylase [Pseudomonas cuatrocienegasensis]